jgi:type II secretory pathway pseudopilin PulG
MLKRNKKGFTILEVTVSLGIAMLGLLGVVSLVMQNMQAQSFNKYYLTASMLAQEGLELVRNIRDENWLTFGVDWDDDINTSDGTFTIDYNGRGSIDYVPNSISDSGTRLYREGNNYYTHNSIATSPTLFHRLITVTPKGADKLDVVVTVQWQAHGRTHQYVAETYLYNWR